MSLFLMALVGSDVNLTKNFEKKHEIKEAAVLNVQTTVLDFQMTTRSPIFTYSLKNISKLVLKRLVYITF